MKRAFSTVACMDADAPQIIEACYKYQMDGVEIRLDKDNSVLGKQSKEELEELAKVFRLAGITVVDLGSSICIKEYNEKHTLTMQRILECAEQLDAKGIRVFLGNFSSKVNPNLPKPDYEGIVRQLKELCTVANVYNTEVWVETHNEFATGKVLKQLISDVDCHNLKIIWDIMHPIEDGEGIKETWGYIGDRIAHVHIKDGFDRKDPVWHDYQYTCLGEGALPIGSIIKLLENEGYQGYYSLEWEAAWRGELAGYENSLDWVLKQYTDYLEAYQKNQLKVTAETIIDNRVQNACLKKYGVSTVIEPGKTYHLTVPYQEYVTNSYNTVYGMITLYTPGGIMTRRIYLEQELCGRKGITFTAVDENELKLELGLKGFGKAVFYQPLLQECPRKPERKVRVASVFIKVKKELSYGEHLRQIEDGIDRAAKDGVDLVGLAENLNTRVQVIPEEEIFGTLDGMYCSMLKRKAKEHQCYIFCSFNELDEEGVRRNTAVLFGRNGEIAGKYYKTHIAMSEYERGIVPGDVYPVFDTDFGRVGLLICWDAYFPGPARAMVQQGAEMLLIPTAGNPTYRHIARAKEHGVYTIVSCVDGTSDSGIACTKIIDPCGEILAYTKEDGQAAKAVIDLNEEKHIYWLSVGAADAIPANIYRHEVRDDLKDMF